MTEMVLNRMCLILNNMVRCRFLAKYGLMLTDATQKLPGPCLCEKNIRYSQVTIEGLQTTNYILITSAAAICVIHSHSHDTERYQK